MLPKNAKLIVAAAAMCCLGLSAAVKVSHAAAPESSDPIKLALHEWTGQHVSTYIAGEVLKKMGYTVEYVTAAYLPSATGLSDGNLTGKRLFCELGSDGMTIDTAGNVYLTGKGVTVFDGTGKQIEHIPVREGWTANVCFGGKDMRTLFITACKGLYSLKMRVTGAGRAVRRAP